MSITAITTTTDDINKGKIDLRFGRCEYFLIINQLEQTFKFYKNIYINNKTGAGFDSIEFLKTHNVNRIITGSVGSKVMELVEKNKIRLIIAKENDLDIKTFLSKMKISFVK